jgi:hypothetical protein
LVKNAGLGGSEILVKKGYRAEIFEKMPHFPGDTAANGLVVPTPVTVLRCGFLKKS